MGQFHFFRQPAYASIANREAIARGLDGLGTPLPCLPVLVPVPVPVTRTFCCRSIQLQVSRSVAIPKELDPDATQSVIGGGAD